MKKRLIWTGSILVVLFVLLLVLAMTVDITPNSVINLHTVDSPPVLKPIVYNDFWSAMDGLEFGYTGQDRSADPELGLFASAASALAYGNLSYAKEMATRLSSTTADSVLKLYADDLYYNALTAGNEWSAYFDEAPTYAEMASGDSSSACLPDTRLLVEGWQKPPLETWDWNSERIVLPLKENRVGHAMLEVEVNGVAKWFIIDTGADMYLNSGSRPMASLVLISHVRAGWLSICRRVNSKFIRPAIRYQAIRRSDDQMISQSGDQTIKRLRWS